MRKIFVFLMVAGLVIAGSGIAQADSWLTTPILGYGSSYDGDVVINSGPNPTVIPHNFMLDGTADDAFFGTGSPSMSIFMVGQEVHTGSGVYLDAGLKFNYFAYFTDLTDSSRSKDYWGLFTSDGFWMTWNTPAGGGDGGGLPTLTDADIGNWTYTEVYTSFATGQQVLLSEVQFTVVADSPAPVPEPGTMMLLGSGLIGLVGYGKMRFKK